MLVFRGQCPKSLTQAGQLQGIPFFWLVFSCLPGTFYCHLQFQFPIGFIYWSKLYTAIGTNQSEVKFYAFTTFPGEPIPQPRSPSLSSDFSNWFSLDFSGPVQKDFYRHKTQTNQPVAPVACTLKNFEHSTWLQEGLGSTYKQEVLVCNWKVSGEWKMSKSTSFHPSSLADNLRQLHLSEGARLLLTTEKAVFNDMADIWFVLRKYFARVCPK